MRQLLQPMALHTGAGSLQAQAVASLYDIMGSLRDR